MKRNVFLLILLISIGLSCNKNNTPRDTNKPYIVILGSNPIFSELGKPYNDPGANAYDITATGDTINITSRLRETDNVDINTQGTYKVHYNVSDEAGNNADEKVRTVYIQVFK